MEIKVTIEGKTRTLNTKDMGLIPDTNGCHLMGYINKSKLNFLISCYRGAIRNVEYEKSNYLNSVDGVADDEILKHFKGKIDFEKDSMDKAIQLLKLAESTKYLKVISMGEPLEDEISVEDYPIAKNCIIPIKDTKVDEQFTISLNNFKTNKIISNLMKQEGLLDNLIAGVVAMGYSESDFKLFKTCVLSYVYEEDSKKGLLPVLKYANKQENVILDVEEHYEDFVRLNDFIKEDILPKYLVKPKKNKVHELCNNLTIVKKLINSAVLMTYFELVDANYMYKTRDLFNYSLDESKNKLFTKDINKVCVEVELYGVKDSCVLTVARKKE